MAIETPANPLPTVDSLTEITLDGQPSTDRAFSTPNGTKLRARVIMKDERAAQAPVNGNAQLAPSMIVLSLSLAKLNDDLSVATDDAGRLLIMDAHEVVVSDQMFNGDFAANLDLILRQQAYELERRMTDRAAVQTYLASAWGGAAAPTA